MMLGGQLRRLREDKGITREAAGYEIRSSESKISRMELGRVSFKERDVADLLTFYGLTDEEERTALLNLARDANTPGWWHRAGDILPNWFQPYVGLESAASIIRTYELQFVPGLLQTPDYARAVILLGHATALPSEVQRRVNVRMTRQELLTRSDAPHLWAVIDEGALRRLVGGLDVMRAQIAALIDATKMPNVHLQLMPFDFGGHAAAGGSFTILRFPEQDLPDVVYVEQLNSAIYLDKRDDVEAYLAAMERLAVQADPPNEASETLGRFLRELDARSA
ncbi:MAG TPA: helix-turn-helix transcriptional regulator [Jiangellaceae bacterium]|jgi:transcriptional regulator with XRE-family HTH domain|nr:helix-turn-helix transcriptional regulator [Jiangellaceae bacterium]